MLKTPQVRYLAAHGLEIAQGLIVIYLQESNAFNCNVIGIGCLNAYSLFAVFDFVLLHFI